MNDNSGFKFNRHMKNVLAATLALAIASLSFYFLSLGWQRFNLALHKAKHEDSLAIQVEGNAKKTIFPDTAVFEITLTALEPEVALASKKVVEKGVKLKSLLGKFEIDEKDQQTKSYSIQPEIEYYYDKTSKSQKTRVKGQRVKQVIGIRTKKMENLGKLLGELGALEVSATSDISFVMGDYQNTYEELKREAIANAKEKAKKMAAGLELKLGELVFFSDGGQNSFYELNPEEVPATEDLDPKATMPKPKMTSRPMGNSAYVPVGSEEISAQVILGYRVSR